jgi:membrane protein
MAARSVWWRAIHGFRAHHGSMLASAVSFWAMLSLLPSVLLAVSVAGHLIGSSDEAFRRTMSYLADVFTGDTRVLEAPMREAVEARGEVGGLGLGILLWSGTQWIVTLETALNALFGAPPRTFLISRLMAVLLFVFVAGLLLCSTAVTGMVAAVTNWRIPVLQFSLGRIPFLWQAVGYALPALFSVLTFSLVYRLLPNTEISHRTAWSAGVVAGIAWEAAKVAYTWYLARFAHLDALFGSVGALAGLVLWVYYSSVIALLGGEWARVLEEAVPRQASKRKRERGHEGERRRDAGPGDHVHRRRGDRRPKK